MSCFTSPGPAPLVAVVKPGGTLVSTLLRSADDLQAENVKVVSIYASPSAVTWTGSPVTRTRSTPP